jgi:hypothetical protein
LDTAKDIIMGPNIDTSQSDTDVIIAGHNAPGIAADKQNFIKM